MADQLRRSQGDVAPESGEREVAKALEQEGVARTVGESVLTGGVVGLAVTGAAFLAARFARVRRRRTAVDRPRRG